MSTRATNKILQPASLLRLAADAALIQVAIIVALVIRYVIVDLIQAQPGDDLPLIASNYFSAWYTKSFLLMAVCLICMGIAGVYTRRRFYMGRYKALAVLQAISIAFFVYGTVRYLAPTFLASGYPIPRGALFLAFGIAAALLIGARSFMRVWQVYGHDETTRVDVKTDESDKRVLVVGGAGYIGSALVPELLSEGYKVRVLDAMLFGEEPLASVKDHENLEVIRTDFRSGLIGWAMRDVSTVVHLAGIVGDPACNLDESLTVDIN